MKPYLAHRLETVCSLMEQAGLDGMIIHQPPYLFHLTEWLPASWVGAYLVVSSGSVVLTSSLVPDTDPIWDTAIPFDTFSLTEEISATANMIDALTEALTQADLIGKQVGVALGALPMPLGQLLAQNLTLADASSVLAAATAIKDAQAQQAIRERVRMLDRGFEAAAQSIQAGVKEIAVYGDIYRAIAQELGSPFSLDCNFGSGPRALPNEPQPTHKLLAEGEVVLIDLFPNLGGYVADYTRNFVVGQPTEAQQHQHRALEKALATAADSLRPGMLASEVDRIARHVVEEEGYGAYAYQHHTGHAFGVTTPEAPWLIPADHTALRAGMVIAIEPGIYHPINGGMRLEGNYIITEDGSESLAGYPTALTICEAGNRHHG